MLLWLLLKKEQRTDLKIGLIGIVSHFKWVIRFLLPSSRILFTTLCYFL